MNKKRIIIIRILTGILTIGIMGLIFSFSMQNGEESSGLSDVIVEWIQNVIIQPFQIQNESVNQFLEENLGFIVRKLAHFSIYTALGMSATGFFLTFESISQRNRFLFAGILGCVYAMTDEIHQLFSPGRSGQVTDVLLDSLGVVFGIAIIYLVQKILFRKQKRTKISQKEK